MDYAVDLCIITEYFHPVLSGATERFRRYLPGLRARGIDAKIFTIWTEGLEHQEMIGGSFINRLSLPSSSHHRSAELARQTLQFFRASGRWPDVVHVISHTLHGVPYLLEMRLRGIPCTNSITMKPVTNTQTRRGRIKLLLHQWLRYRVFNQIIVSSQVISQAAQCYGIPAKRIRVITNGVDFNRFHPIENSQVKQQLREKLGFNADDQIVLFVGMISERKGVDLLIKAWPDIYKVHSQAKLVLIGPADRKGQFTDSFEHKLRDVASTRINYLKSVEHIEAYMQIADVLVLPSRLEGFGNVVGEGMACALPCVLTPFDGLPESFGQPGLHYVLTSFHPTQIAADINKLLSNPVLRRVIGQTALNRARNEQDLETALDKHAEVYHYWTHRNRNRNARKK